MGELAAMTPKKFRVKKCALGGFGVLPVKAVTWFIIAISDTYRRFDRLGGRNALRNSLALPQDP